MWSLPTSSADIFANTFRRRNVNPYRRRKEKKHFHTQQTTRNPIVTFAFLTRLLRFCVAAADFYIANNCCIRIKYTNVDSYLRLWDQKQIVYKKVRDRKKWYQSLEYFSYTLHTHPHKYTLNKCHLLEYYTHKINKIDVVLRNTVPHIYFRSDSNLLYLYRYYSSFCSITKGKVCLSPHLVFVHCVVVCEQVSSLHTWVCLCVCSHFSGTVHFTTACLV